MTIKTRNGLPLYISGAISCLCCDGGGGGGTENPEDPEDTQGEIGEKSLAPWCLRVPENTVFSHTKTKAEMRSILQCGIVSGTATINVSYKWKIAFQPPPEVLVVNPVGEPYQLYEHGYTSSASNSIQINGITTSCPQLPSLVISGTATSLTRISSFYNGAKISERTTEFSGRSWSVVAFLDIASTIGPTPTFGFVVSSQQANYSTSPWTLFGAYDFEDLTTYTLTTSSSVCPP